ncbi:hypothetical protein CERSUDRAFT_84812 [Gelatoporia subvermispora B]|uniref:DUF6534 domain-containing protein n=1 Tax=Ceriporiopsis subvermispora (strain B) TaxID=914234 RepID=M2RA85_CERS8|nr:hypothetical protein CERSUDRAFT_84812 [Gelatoporia subvermispora B]
MHAPGVGVDDAFGPLLIGYTIMLSLYGLALAQTIVYLRRSRGDLIGVKLAVIVLWIIDNTHVAVAIIAMYMYLVHLHGDAHGVGLTSWPLGAQVYLTGLSDMIVRSVYAHRIWSLNNRSILLPALIVFLSILTLAMGLIYGVALAKPVSWAASRTINWCGYVGDCCEILADAVITFKMTRLLLRLRLGSHKNDPVLITILTYSVNTGLLTTLCVVASLILLATAAHSSAGLAIYIALSKLYLNALLGTLNARRRAEVSGIDDIDPILTTQVTISPPADYWDVTPAPVVILSPPEQHPPTVSA